MRVAGAGHSFSGGVVTEGTLISLDQLARVLDADAATGLVRVEAGIRLHQLSQELHARGLAMPNLGDIDAQSLAGALSTGTHGTGTRFPNLAAQVESVELILADGSERIVRDGDLLRAARVSLGALGVIVGRDDPLRAGVQAADRGPAGAARRGPRLHCRSAPTRTTTSSSGRSRTRTPRSCARSTRPTRRSPARAARARTRATC